MRMLKSGPDYISYLALKPALKQFIFEFAVYLCINPAGRQDLETYNSSLIKL